MSLAKNKPVVIVGGGVSGLTLAYLLVQRDIPTVLIEKEKRPGGLARSFRYGDFVFDIGPHRFHSDLPVVSNLILDVLGARALTISRHSSVRFAGTSYPWPLQPSLALFRFPLRVSLGILRDLLTLYRISPAATFKDYIVNMYGRTLFELFFEGYSSKFLGVVPELTHLDWAKTGIDRSIIDKRLQISSLRQLLLAALLPSRHPPLRFLYPAGGCDQFTVELAARFQSKGGELICGSGVDGLELDRDGTIRAVRAGGRQWEASAVVWTGDLHTLLGLLGLPRPKLKYLSLVCYNLMLTDGAPFPFQWCYHGAPDIIFSRVSSPAGFDPALVPPGRRSLCVEVTAPDDKGAFLEPEKFLERVVFDATRERLLVTAQEVIDVRTERIPYAYPVYSLDYRDELDRVQRALATTANLYPFGRQGQFWYNNMDHCIEAALELADRLTAARV